MYIRRICMYCWLIDCNWLFCPGTDQLTEWFMAGCLKEKLTPLSWNSPNNWIIYGRFIDRITDSPVITDQHTEWFIAGWLTDSTVWELANLPNTHWVIHWPTEKLYDWLHCTAWLLTNILNYLWLIDGITDSIAWELTNLRNDLWLIDWLSNWLYCRRSDQVTGMALIIAVSLTDWLVLLSKNWQTYWMLTR